ncbi:MAG: hypothetical protein IJ568_04190 [Bacilli bacterium]|nr:hypothetical protein [Bacilli bacterium]
MKKTLSIILFVVGFIATYLIMCYCIPGLRIKLAAEPKEYFIESIKYAAIFKTITSCVVGGIFAALPYIIKKK